MGQEGTDINQNEDDSAVNQLEEQSQESASEPGTPEQKTLRKYTGRTQPQPSVQSIRGHEGSAETGALPMSTYFPGMENNIQKGYYSGSMVGSNPIYAPSGLYPFGMIDAHRQALARAADQKVAEQDAWAQKMADATKAPTTKRKAVQEAMQNDFYKGISDYKAKFMKENPDFQGDINKALMRDQGFNQYLSDQHTRFEMEDQGVDTYAKNQAEAAKSGKIMFAPQKQVMADFMSGKVDSMMASTDPAEREKSKAIHAEIMNQQVMNDPQKVLEDFKKSNDPDDIESLQGISPKSTYDLITTGSTKGIKNPAAAQRMVAGLGQLYDTEYGGRENQTGINKQQFIAEGLNQYGTTKKITVQTPSNQKNANNDNIEFNPNDLTTAGKVVTAQSKGNALTHPATVEEAVNGVKEGDLVPTMKQKVGANGAPMFDASGDKNPIMEQAYDEPKTYNFSTGAGGLTLTKPLKMSLAEGAHWTNLGDSKGGSFDVQKTSGVKDVTIGDIHPFPVYAGTDKVIPQKKADELIKDHPEQVEYKQFGVSKFNENGSNGKPEEKSALIPFSEMENSINEKDKSGKMVSTMKAAAKAETEKMHQANGIQLVTTQSAYDKLPKGAKYKDSNGTIATKK